ncbi:MAG TPA: DNA recombination protein RmuC [Candidatus Paceibacterota bacterium]|nr:DNA recombination protein RmuC [Candidatus Paceibacterota bacterium]
MDISILLIVLALLVGQGIVFWFIFSRKGESTADSGGLAMLQQQLGELTRTLDARVAESSKQVHETVRTQLGESARLIKDVTVGLTKLDETNRQVVSFADQLQNLQDILKNPKQRGILGEYYLESVLESVLPTGAYQMQYPFPNGEIVDAVVFVKDRIVPVDSKFSLENYNRLLESRDPQEREQFEKLFKQDLKLRIDETSKYVRPEENTTDFALMFIPAEGVYYDMLVGGGASGTRSRDLIEYAFGKRVIIVSPSSFLAYLQTVMQGLRSLQIEQQTKEIQKRVVELGKHLGAYDEYYKKLGNALSTTVNHWNAGYKELGKIDKDVLRITGEGIGLDPESIDRPLLEGKE